MRLGLNLGYRHRTAGELVQLTRTAESLGFDSVWTSEAYGYDAITPLAWLAGQTRTINLGTAIAQMPARSPAMTAMTALTLDFLSGGRTLLGLGVSGPQVVEGWHGVLYGKPLGRTREYVAILRSILNRDAPLEFDGEHYQIPVRDGTGLGKPLRLIAAPLRSDIPIFLAALGPKNIALTAEIADGWLPIFFSPRRMGVFLPHLKKGLERAGGGKSLADLEIAPTVQVVLGDDIDACRALVKADLSFYAGGMGARGRNFYNLLIRRYGYEEFADRVEDLFLTGRKQEAARIVPDELVDEIALCGPRERIADLLEPWKEAGIGTLICAPNRVEALQVLAELTL